jgi:LuxR family maltose regulon positive regulatory protein
MATPLLKTKLYIPSIRPDPSTGLPSTALGAGRTRLVPRPRLIERLNEGLLRKLTLVSAPAGFGKTTLVNAWLRSTDRPFTWISLTGRGNTK